MSRPEASRDDALPPALMGVGDLARELGRDVDMVRRLLRVHGVPLMQPRRKLYVTLVALEAQWPEIWNALMRQHALRAALVREETKQ